MFSRYFSPAVAFLLLASDAGITGGVEAKLLTKIKSTTKIQASATQSVGSKCTADGECNLPCHLKCNSTISDADDFSMVQYTNTTWPSKLEGILKSILANPDKDAYLTGLLNGSVQYKDTASQDSSVTFKLPKNAKCAILSSHPNSTIAAAG